MKKMKWAAMSMVYAPLLAAAAAAQTPTPAPAIPTREAAEDAPAAPPGTPSRPNYRSPVVAPDGVTFSVYAPAAKAVTLASSEIARVAPAAKELTRAANGVWSLTVALPPGLYEYGFDVDGLRLADPDNPEAFAGARGARTFVEVPGPPGHPRYDEWRDVPHGAVSVHWYDSKVTGSRRRVHVYTPPGYAASAARLPALYLLHGNGGTDAQWATAGRANVIADNLIAYGKAQPMVIVMPDGHTYDPPPGQDPKERRRMKEESFEGDLLREVVPLVERTYRVAPGRENRAIAGLSMGGGQSLAGGFRMSDAFAWVGGFSSSLGAAIPLVPARGAAAEAYNARTRLFWMAIGTDDFIYKLNRDFHDQLAAAGVRHEYVEQAGAHTWGVFREALALFMPKLFRAQAGQASR